MARYGWRQSNLSKNLTAMARGQASRRREGAKNAKETMGLMIAPFTFWVSGIGNQKDVRPLNFFANLCVLCAFAVNICFFSGFAK
jgi:hypothetical protein